MALSALDSIEDAFEATREFLLPVSAGRWLRMAVVVFFVGSTGVAFPPVGGSWNVEGSVPGEPGPEWPVDGPRDVVLSDLAIAAIVGAVALVVLLGLAWLFVASVMEFVLVEALRSDAVRVRAYWGRHWRRGVRLFGFRVALGLLVLALVVPPVAVGALWLLEGQFSAAALLVVAALAIPVLFVVGVAVALANAFTTVFVVPVMLVADCGVIDGWRRLWPRLRARWQEFGLYAVLAFVLNGLLSAGLATVVGVAAVVLAVPFGLLGLFSVALLAFSPLALALVGVLVLAYVAALAAVSALAMVPVKTFLRFYALFVLGDVAPEYDPIPRARTRVRGEDPEGTGGPGEGYPSR